MPDGRPEPGQGLRVSRTLVIPPEELEWRFSTSGGPGGQHANRSSTKAEVRFDIASSPSLGPRQRARLLDRFGPVARASAGEERSQARNRGLALERLRGRLAGALAVQRRRTATAPTKSSVARRLEHKRRHGQLKRRRAAPSADDD